MIVYSKVIVTISVMTSNITNVATVTNVVIVTVETNVLLPIKKRKARNEILKTNLKPIS